MTTNAGQVTNIEFSMRLLTARNRTTRRIHVIPRATFIFNQALESLTRYEYWR